MSRDYRTQRLFPLAAICLVAAFSLVMWLRVGTSRAAETAPDSGTWVGTLTYDEEDNNETGSPPTYPYSETHIQVHWSVTASTDGTDDLGGGFSYINPQLTATFNQTLFEPDCTSEEDWFPGNEAPVEVFPGNGHLQILTDGSSTYQLHFPSFAKEGKYINKETGECSQTTEVPGTDSSDNNGGAPDQSQPPAEPLGSDPTHLMGTWHPMQYGPEFSFNYSWDLHLVNASDSDGDGLSDYLETVKYGTDPNNPDTDGDGCTDGQEVAEGTNPLDPTSHSCHGGTEEGGNGGSPNGPGWPGNEGGEAPGGGPPPPPPGKKPVYVALGDSFSSGEGACKPGGAREQCDYAPSTNVTSGASKDECHRSHNAYPELVRQALPSTWGFVFAACSGDKIRELFHENKKWHALEPAEIEAIHHHVNTTEDVTLITMSIGGNDMGFSEVLKRCILIGCFSQPGHAGLQLPLPAKEQPCGDRAGLSGLNLIEFRLLCAYTEVGKAAPDAKLYVIGYPHLFAKEAKGNCAITPNETEEVDYFEDRFNGRIHNAVNAANKLAGRPFAIFVNNEHTFDGHELCSGLPNHKEYLNGYLPAAGPPFHHPESFHPNAVGQQHLADRVLEALGL
jgi:lysophospholipase L1-like esterase